VTLNRARELDLSAAFLVYSKRADGQSHKHEVKALGLLWAKFPDFYSSANTIHLDDLSRNL
jgi:ubiquitin-like domain-containing CTD phosphatase 1